jgi:phospholipase C
MQEKRAAALTRRQALREIGIATAAASALGAGIDDLIGQAIAASPKRGSLRDIEHVVILMQENRSFDHYFGTLSGVRGFGDKHGRKAFFQRSTSGRTIHPFHLKDGCLPDLTHDWGPQHRAWNHGHMNHFVRAHEAVDASGVAPETMGYYKRRDLNFYFALADAFTICDAYHCSVIGPTDPNRLMSMSATIDPGGKHGGPWVHTNVLDRTPRFSWTTMPEHLQKRGVSWKVYTDPGTGAFDNVLTYFKQYAPGSALASRGIVPTYPTDFMNDLASGRLPHVSWVLPSVASSEHPGFSTPVSGELVARQVVEALVSHPKVWRKTALFLTWDENGGFFDHVKPPTPPRHTKGEFLTVAKLPAEAEGIRGPIGLGFRVPMLVVSPFSRGGLVCSDVFDHTSTLRFLETRFGARVPNLTPWRRRVTGDLTGAFNFAARPRYGRPRLPEPNNSSAAQCIGGSPPPVPHERFPRQARGKRPRPSGIVHHHRHKS